MKLMMKIPLKLSIEVDESLYDTVNDNIEEIIEVAQLKLEAYILQEIVGWSKEGLVKITKD